MRYSTYLRAEGWCWVLIGGSMVICCWPGLVVAEPSVVPFFLIGTALTAAWLLVALTLRGTCLRDVHRWMAGGRLPRRERERTPMTTARLVLVLARDVVFWAGGTVVFYVGCALLDLPPGLSNGAISLGMGAAITALGLLEALVASRRADTDDRSRGVTTSVLRHHMMAFGRPVLSHQPPGVRASAVVADEPTDSPAAGLDIPQGGAAT